LGAFQKFEYHPRIWIFFLQLRYLSGAEKTGLLTGRRGAISLEPA
jgi:hypothetical protein